MFAVAVRGIHSFSHVQTIVVNSFDELFSLYRVMAKESIMGDLKLEWINAEGKRVMLYLHAASHDMGTLQQYCKPVSGPSLYMVCTPQENRLTGSGTTSLPHHKADHWLYIEPKNHPGSKIAIDTLKVKIKEAARLRQIEEEKEEARQQEIESTLEDAMTRVGYDNVIKALKNL